MTAHSALHFCVGLVVGAAGMAVAVARGSATGRKLAGTVGKWLLWSYGLGLFAVTPNLLRRLGAAEPFVSGVWMNVFLFHPLIDSMKKGGMVVGMAGIVCCFFVQYSLILWAVIRARNEAGLPHIQTGRLEGGA